MFLIINPILIIISHNAVMEFLPVVTVASDWPLIVVVSVVLLRQREIKIARGRARPRIVP